jgi:hypothetical protein
VVFPLVSHVKWVGHFLDFLDRLSFGSIHVHSPFLESLTSVTGRPQNRVPPLLLGGALGGCGEHVTPRNF